MNVCNNVGYPGNNAYPYVTQKIDQLAYAITQIAAVVTQVNGVPIPPGVEQLGVQIPQVVIP